MAIKSRKIPSKRVRRVPQVSRVSHGRKANVKKAGKVSKAQKPSLNIPSPRRRGLGRGRRELTKLRNQTLPNVILATLIAVSGNFLWKKLLGKTLMALGAFIIVATIFLTQLQYITPTQSTVVLSKQQTDDSYPVSVEIPNVISPETVEKGFYRYDLWSLSDNHPMYLETSGTPGKPGNIVIYGHDTNQIFANLRRAQKGSVVTIKTNTGQTFSYQINSIKTVLPTNVEILQQGRVEQITLFTCTGIFDSMRLVVSGKRIS